MNVSKVIDNRLRQWERLLHAGGISPVMVLGLQVETNIPAILSFEGMTDEELLGLIKQAEYVLLRRRPR